MRPAPICCPDGHVLGVAEIAALSQSELEVSYYCCAPVCSLHRAAPELYRALEALLFRLRREGCLPVGTPELRAAEEALRSARNGSSHVSRPARTAS